MGAFAEILSKAHDLNDFVDLTHFGKLLLQNVNVKSQESNEQTATIEGLLHF